jgi:hypothetical protein
MKALPAPEGYCSLRDAVTRSHINIGILRRDQHCGKIASTKIARRVFLNVASLDQFTVDWNSREHVGQ